MALTPCANSLVGVKIMTWQWGDFGSMEWRTPIIYAEVLPVSNLAETIVSFFPITDKIIFCWIMDGMS